MSGNAVVGLLCCGWALLAAAVALVLGRWLR